MTADCTGGFADTLVTTALTIDHVPTRFSLFALQTVTLRAALLNTPPLPPQADRYVLLRDFYLRGREAQINQ
jgi:phospholipid-binding lipoprotein MlaA